ncbi:nucleoside-diphosphate sugar epimerase/dehydratase [Ruminococcus sp. NK3A76]|uniref:polysaccharide biosynthesis protein n=1 Tax=Ruminococcus sp. NK3A76 TaxID=877411 RepID=UPI0009FFC993
MSEKEKYTPASLSVPIETSASYIARHTNVIKVLLAGYDVVAVTLCYFLALWFRFDGSYSSIRYDYLLNFLGMAPLYAIICVCVFRAFKLYNSIWRYASIVELLRIIYATAVTGLIHTVLITFIFGRMPLTYYCLGIMIQFVFTLGIRFCYRFFIVLRQKRRKSARPASRVMIIGAGEAGRVIIRELLRSGDVEDIPVCIIDDDPSKWHRSIEGVPVVGGREDILSAAQRYKIEKIYFSIPAASKKTKRDILSICSESGCQLKSLPGIYQLANGEVNLSKMKEVAIEDLLGRDQINVNMDEIYDFISGKVVLVSGGGGSIGSQIAASVAQHNPRQLIIFDVYENNAYEIQQQLLRKDPSLNLVVLIGSVRDSRRVNDVFNKYRPDIVYHAAAHKHVPLMEVSPCEAVKNNVIGTYKMAYAAMMYGTQRFVLISTDKAVNPTNIMGATKRLCELVVQSFDKKIKANRECDIPVLHIHEEDEDSSMYPLSQGGEMRRDEKGDEVFTLPGQDGLGHRKAQTQFVAVRFGNVLGSNGSVIPLFKKQIADGGPVTVTHPDIIRYFMTIPEAANLVLQAGTYAKGGEIFVLDMGEPVKIVDLARNLIRLSGFEPDVDIKIEYTGLRPGEKLYEEKLMSEEGLTKTPNDLIHIGKPTKFDEDEFLSKMEDLMLVSYENSEAIRLMVREMVNTYHPTEELSREQERIYRDDIERILRKNVTKKAVNQ